jgi:UbiD family decarboxylase
MKCYKDFREFLSVLEPQGQLLRIKDEVKFEPDLVSAGSALAQIGDTAPAILFDKIARCAASRMTEDQWTYPVFAIWAKTS